MRTLFTHDTYAGAAEFPQPGPVYVHSATATATKGTVSSGAARSRADVRRGQAGPPVVALERTAGGDVESAIGVCSACADVDYVNVRNTKAGCFVAGQSPPGCCRGRLRRWSERDATIAITASAVQTAMTPASPVNTAAITSSGIEIPIAPRVISFWWSRFRLSASSLAPTLGGARLDPLEEGVDHLRLALEAELLPRLDRELELLLGTIGSLTP